MNGRSKFGVGGADVGRTVWRVADNLEKTLPCKFLFSWQNFYLYVTRFAKAALLLEN